PANRAAKISDAAEDWWKLWSRSWGLGQCRRFCGLERRGKPDGEQDQREAHAVIPREFFLQHEPRKHHEDGEGDAFLNDLQLIAAELPAEIAAPIGGDHQAILEKRDAP